MIKKTLVELKWGIFGMTNEFTFFFNMVFGVEEYVLWGVKKYPLESATSLSRVDCVADSTYIPATTRLGEVIDSTQ